MIPIPPIPSLPAVSETSLANLTLTLGRPVRTRHAAPTRCWCHAARPADGRSPRRSPTPTAPVAASSPRSPARRRSSVAPPNQAAAAVATPPGQGPPGARRHRCQLPRAQLRERETPRTVSLHETGNLRLTSKHGFTLNEQGSATGTFSGTIYVHLTIVSSSRVKAEVSISRSGGSISGEATASYHRSQRERQLLRLAVGERRHRQLRARPRLGPQLRRHDPDSNDAIDRAPQRPDLGLTGGAPAMLELRDLVKHYPAIGGESVRAVDGVSLRWSPARWWRCTGRAARARRRCC